MVTLFDAATSDRIGNITVHKLVGRLDNSAVSATGAKLAFKSNEEIAFQVRTVPLDEVIPTSERVLLLKIDVQGREYHVLKGAIKLLSRKGSQAPYLIYEEDERLLQASNSSAKEIRDSLHNMGYHDCTQHGTYTHSMLAPDFVSSIQFPPIFAYKNLTAFKALQLQETSTNGYGRKSWKLNN